MFYRYLATKKIKALRENNMHNIQHKRQQHTVNTLRAMLKHNNSTIVKADKCKAIVIIIIVIKIVIINKEKSVLWLPLPHPPLNTVAASALNTKQSCSSPLGQRIKISFWGTTPRYQQSPAMLAINHLPVIL